MESPTVVIPVKKNNPKSRLSKILSPGERRELVRAMLNDVLAVLLETDLLRRTILVSDDEEILRLTTERGTTPLREWADGGVNAAVESAITLTSESEGWLILPADLPFLTARDISRALELIENGAQVVLSPSRRFDGTNLLLFGRETRMQLSYDSDSFRGHLTTAASSGYSVAVYCSRTVMLDIDSEEDVNLALACRIRNATTKFLASKLGREV